MYNKITTGFVIQTFNDDGTPNRQEFVAGDQCVYENLQGEAVTPPEEEHYFLYDMVNPPK